MSGGAAEAAGRIVARTLAGAWRLAPPPPEVSEQDLVAVAPALLRTGSAPLAFRRHRAVAAGAPALAALQDAWRMQTLHAALFEEHVPIAMAHLRARGVEPLVAKGWAVARLYPQPGLRPYGDIDVYVRPADYDAARAAVDAMPRIAVDLHRGLVDLDDRDHDAVLARAAHESVGGVDVPVLAPEDHLRLLCRHLLRHGVSRPVWLCDAALLVETRAPGFDWDRLLAGSPRRREAILAALGLAGALLEADLRDTPAAGLAEALPRWIVPAVLKEWGAGRGHRVPLATYLFRPAALGAELRRHWPNAVEASAEREAPFDGRPRLPFQIAHTLRRAARFGLSLARGLRRRPPGGIRTAFIGGG